MKVLVAGATGVIGRPLVTRLVADGHEVWGMTRRPARVEAIEAQGAHGVVADALDAEAVRRAVETAAPDVIVQQLTQLPQEVTPKSMAEGYRATDHVRHDGTLNLLAAAGGARVIAQSIAFVIAPQGPWVADEDAPLFVDAPDGEIIRRIGAMEQAVVEAGGIALRYGFFYGPGTWYARDGSVGEMVRKRRYPIIGDGAGTWSFLHIDDAVDATIRVLGDGAPGIYNVTDDDPVPMREWLPSLASAIGAKPPRRVPVWLARPVAGHAAVFYSTQVRGSSNARFKRAFGWEPSVPSWREGFRAL